MKFDISKKILQDFIGGAQWDIGEAQQDVDMARAELDKAMEKLGKINEKVGAAESELANLMRLEIAEPLFMPTKSENKPTL